MNLQETKIAQTQSTANNDSETTEFLQNEISVRSTKLFEADFNVYADRGSNCLKSNNDTED